MPYCKAFIKQRLVIEAYLLELWIAYKYAQQLAAVHRSAEYIAAANAASSRFVRESIFYRIN